jgi:two-component system cell cycle response regulator CpdR
MTTRRLALVPDDEPSIWPLVTRVVRQLGLDVLAVTNGAAAIATVQAHHGDLACAILDIVIPVLNGIDAAHALQEIAPGLPIVLMSGAIPVQYTGGIERLSLAGILHKPYPLAALRELVRHTVDDGIAIKAQR